MGKIEIPSGIRVGMHDMDRSV